MFRKVKKKKIIEKILMIIKLLYNFQLSVYTNLLVPQLGTLQKWGNIFFSSTTVSCDCNQYAAAAERPVCITVS